MGWNIETIWLMTNALKSQVATALLNQNLLPDLEEFLGESYSSQVPKIKIHIDDVNEREPTEYLEDLVDSPHFIPSPTLGLYIIYNLTDSKKANEKDIAFYSSTMNKIAEFLKNKGKQAHVYIMKHLPNNKNFEAYCFDLEQQL